MQPHSKWLQVAGAAYAAHSLQPGDITCREKRQWCVCVCVGGRTCMSACVCEVYRFGHFTPTLAVFRFFSRSVREVQAALQQQLNCFSLPMGISDNIVSAKKTQKTHNPVHLQQRSAAFTRKKYHLALRTIKLHSPGARGHYAVSFMA